MTDQNIEKPAELSRFAMVREAMTRGFFGRCPNCGKGPLFRKFLKVTDECPVCGEAFHHHRADDFPAYIVIVLVGHIVIPLVLAAETAWAWPMWLHLVVWPVTIAVLALALLQPVKGSIVALQWVLGMHGFEEAALKREAAQKRNAARGTFAPAGK